MWAAIMGRMAAGNSFRPCPPRFIRWEHKHPIGSLPFDMVLSMSFAKHSSWVICFALWLTLGTVLVAPELYADEIEIRLVAADRESKPAVDTLVDFRHAAEGGLIATQWISGLKLGNDSLFPIVNRGALAPDNPEVATADPDEKAPLKKTDAEDLLSDIKKETTGNKLTAMRTVDVVDPLYIGQTFSYGREVGPQRTRESSATIETKPASQIQPLGMVIDSAAKQLEIPCYPVTITATIAGQENLRTTFTPQLTCAGQDLLADCLFEHSPDLPLGDTSAMAGRAETLQAWLEGTRGGNRPFRRLTVYLPASGKADRHTYELNGQSFRVTTAGVSLASTSSAASQTAGISKKPYLRLVDKFAMELVLPDTADSRKLQIPLQTDLGPGWKYDGESMISLESGQSVLTLQIKSPAGKSIVLRPSLPAGIEEAGRWHLYASVVAGRAPDEQPVATIVALPRGTEIQKGKVQVLVSSANAVGTAALPQSMTLILRRTYLWSNVMEDDRKLELKRTESGQYEGVTRTIPAAGYLASLIMGNSALPAVPFVVAQAETLGSISLGTYHNRCDYYRGEEVQAAVVVRAIQDVQRDAVPLRLFHTGAGETLPVGSIDVSAAKDETRTVFITLPTSQLRLGEHILSVETEKLVVYPLRFTLYSPEPRTTFALYRWMVGSFSGPVRVGDETVANLLFDQQPAQFLRPEELARFKDQGTPSRLFKSAFESDPLLPAPAKTETYDEETEFQMAVAMRLGLRYAPSYGWGMNSQEANWNPKHTLPEDLARMRRLCSLVTQRFRDFGNFAGLHLNWYPTYGGYWENHPATDGHRDRRAEQLAKEVAAIELTEDEKSKQVSLKLGAEAELELAVKRHKYYVGALPRAYEAETELASTLMPGLSDRPLSEDVGQPGLSPVRPAYTSFLPISWFDQQTYYPSEYFSTLPAATVHAYTDYGFSPFQHLWGLDFWAAGVGNKPKWVTTMSNGRDVMLPQTLLAVARGADGIDINGEDPTASRVISQLLTTHGPFFQKLQPESDVAIITSLRQQIVHGKLVDRWMGYTAGTYFDLYTKLWYARRPPAVLLEEEVTTEKLKGYKAVFLVNQQADLPAEAMTALDGFVASGGTVFKDKTTAAHFPGEAYDLSPGDSIGPKWEGEKYVATRDQMFVGVQASYEASAKSLDALLADLPLPRVMSQSHQTLLGTLTGQNSAVVMAVNDTRTPPGIHHPWNFWSATILAANGELSLDKQYAVYDLLDGGEVLKPAPDAKGRFKLPVSFDRVAGKVFVLTPAPLKELRLTHKQTNSKCEFKADIIDARGASLGDPWPMEITLIDEDGKFQEQYYRALAPKDVFRLQLPLVAKPTAWRVRVKEMVSGLTSELSLPLTPDNITPVKESTTLLPRPHDVREFLSGFRGKGDAKKNRNDVQPLLILLDRAQVVKYGEKLTSAAESIATELMKQGIPTSMRTIDPLDIPEVPQRWQRTNSDLLYLQRAEAGEQPISAAPLTTRYYQGERKRNEPDYLHPESGYGEPAAHFRINSHVILLGLPEENCFLKDLHSSVGMQPHRDWLSSRSGVVQIAFDAFSPGYHALTIQAAGIEGIVQASSAILQLDKQERDKVKELEAPAATSKDKTKTQSSVSLQRSPLPRWQDQFGASVAPMAFTPDGGLLATADMQANNYFKFSADGTLQHKWLGKFGITPAHSGQTLWIYPWWGAPGYLNKVVCANAMAQPQWLMDAPHYSRSFQFWQHPGKAILADRATDDLFIAGECQVARIAPDGKTLWLYDDTSTANDVQPFRFRRDMMLHDVSPDGKLLLVGAFGIEPYSNFVSKFIRPALLLIDATSGKIVWEKRDMLIHHSACNFSGLEGKQILVGDESPARRRLVLFDLQGQELWSIPQPAGVSAANLTADGEQVVLRSAAARNNLFQITGEPQGIQVLSIANRTTLDLPLTSDVSSWKVLSRSGDILVSTSDGRLTRFAIDGKIQWQQQFPGAASFIVSEDEHQMVIGTPDGKLRWLSDSGETVREVNLLEHNRVKDLDQYVRDYTRTPGDISQFSPSPQAPPSIVERGGEVVTFSKNLLSDDGSETADSSLSAGHELNLPATLQSAGTHVFTFTQRLTGDEVTSASNLRVTVTEADSKKIIASAEMPLSSTWQERTMAFRAAKDIERVQVSLKLVSTGDKQSQSVDLRSPGLYAMNFPSTNQLAQRVPAAPGELPAADSEDTFEGSKKVSPPTLRYNIPNDVDLTALARGAPPFQRTVEFTTPFDGKLIGQPTSWLGKPISGSTHATLEIKFDSPVELGSLAVYEDSTSAQHYTDTYALFGREAKTGRMVQLGSVTENKNPFNLFVFPKLQVEAITYLWLKSADGHVRIAELEGYLAEEDLLDP